jgi:uncharacterized Tic20 family protein
METTVNRNTSTIIQLSALTQYFFPLGNYIFPVVIWSLKKEDSRFVDYNGKQAINFQLSLLLYCMVLLIIAVPIFMYAAFSNMELYLNGDFEWVINEFTIEKITGTLLIGLLASFFIVALKVFEFIVIFYAAVKNSNGETYDYPLSIKFIK